MIRCTPATVGGRQRLTIDDGRYHANPRRVIVVRGGHASDANGVGPAVGGFYFEPFRALAETGFVVVSVNATGGTSWWNQASVNDYAADVTELCTTYGCAKVGVVGASMGGGVTAQALKTVKTQVCGGILLCPALDLDFFHNTAGYVPAYDTSPSGGMPTGYAAEMESASAYNTNAAGWAAATAGHKIRDEYASWRGLGFPLPIWHGNLDATVPIGQSQAFVAGVNDPKVTLRTLVGAGHLPMIPLVNGPDVQDYVTFFESLNWS